MCASGERQTFSQGSHGEWFSVEGKDRGVSLLCALLGSISLARGCPGTPRFGLLPSCVHTPLCPQRCQRLTRDPRLGSPWAQCWGEPRAGADGTGGTWLVASLPIALAAHVSGRARSSAQPQGT